MQNPDVQKNWNKWSSSIYLNRRVSRCQRDRTTLRIKIIITKICVVVGFSRTMYNGQRKPRSKQKKHPPSTAKNQRPRGVTNQTNSRGVYTKKIIYSDRNLFTVKAMWLQLVYFVWYYVPVAVRIEQYEPPLPVNNECCCVVVLIFLVRYTYVLASRLRTYVPGIFISLLVSCVVSRHSPRTRTDSNSTLRARRSSDR